MHSCDKYSTATMYWVPLYAQVCLIQWPVHKQTTIFGGTTQESQTGSQGYGFWLDQLPFWATSSTMIGGALEDLHIPTTRQF